MDFIFLLATTNLVIQFIVLALLIISYGLKRRGKFRQHGLTMLSAVILHTVMVLSIMIPSIISIYSITTFPIAVPAIAAVHGAIGAVTWILGLWIVVSWRLRKDLKFCLPKKRFMLATYVLWLVAIALGTLLYLSLYVFLIPLM